MARSLRAPGILDLVISDQPDVILELARDPRLDRHDLPAGPVLNRLLMRRIRRVLQIDGVPLPPVAPHGTARPTPRQTELAARLATHVCSDVHLDALATYLLDPEKARPCGPVVQEILGQLFCSDYRADARSFADAELLDAAVRSNNPFRRLVWWATGRVGQARERLADRVGRNATALHTTAIAVHNLVAAVERMRRLAARPGAFRYIPAAQAVSRSLIAPRAVLRQASAPGRTASADFRAGTLVVFRLQQAHMRTLRRDAAFMTGTWSECPASAWVPRLLAAVWERAAGRDLHLNRTLP